MEDWDILWGGFGMRNEPRVSIVIVNFNGGYVFRDCLESLSKIDYENFELIIIDNGSTDNSFAFVDNWKRKGGVKVVRNEVNIGFAPACNQGYSKSRGEYLLLLNNDTKVEKDFLTKMVERMVGDEEIAVIQPKIYLMDKRGFLDNAGSFFTRIGFLDHWGFMRKDGPEFNTEREVFAAKGACLLIRKVVADKIGLFDNDFVYYFEESDFCFRVWIFGKKILYFPKACIYHKLGYTTRREDVLNINYHYYKNRICSLIKNLEVSSMFLVLTSHMTISIGIAVIFLLKFRIKNFWVIVKALVWNLININETLNKRRKVQKFRKLSDREIFLKLALPVNWKKFYGDFRRVEEDIDR